MTLKASGGRDRRNIQYSTPEGSLWTVVGLMLNNGVHIQSQTDIFFYIYTILTFSLAAAHVDVMAEVKPQKTVKWGS